ncbi:MAG TPA: hypothetical protein VID75_07085 [Acidimicrobiales bacterium]
MDDLSTGGPVGTALSLVKEPDLAWPSKITFAAARLARAWEHVKKEAESGGTSEPALIEMHRAARRLKSLTGKKDLWSAIDVVREVGA